MRTPIAAMAAREPLSVQQEAHACGYDPWGERDATYRTLSDTFVTTKKPAECAICFESIPVGSRVRSKREVDDGKAATFKFCAECCWLMAHRHDEPSDADVDVGTDNFGRLMARYDVGRKKADAARGEGS